jgi:hypothetical protein
MRRCRRLIGLDQRRIEVGASGQGLARREADLPRHGDALGLREQTHDLLVVADRHGGWRGAAVRHAQHLEQRRHVQLLGGDVAKPGVAEVHDQIRRIVREALEQLRMVVQNSKAQPGSDEGARNDQCEVLLW